MPAPTALPARHRCSGRRWWQRCLGASPAPARSTPGSCAASLCPCTSASCRAASRVRGAAWAGVSTGGHPMCGQPTAAQSRCACLAGCMAAACAVPSSMLCAPLAGAARAACVVAQQAPQCHLPALLFRPVPPRSALGLQGGGRVSQQPAVATGRHLGAHSTALSSPRRLPAAATPSHLELLRWPQGPLPAAAQEPRLRGLKLQRWHAHTRQLRSSSLLPRSRQTRHRHSTMT